MMSEPETNIEIEDVLSSIRRLVSRDAGGSRMGGVPHRSASLAATARAMMPEPVAAPEPEPVLAAVTEALAEPVLDLPTDPEPESRAEPEVISEPVAAEPAAPAEDAAPEAAFLVLSPALRIAENEAEAPRDCDSDEPPPEIEAEQAPQDAPQQAGNPMFETEHSPAGAAEAPPPLLLQPSAQVARETAPKPAARPMTEAEALLAEAEAALAESGALLADASTALEAAGETAGEAAGEIGFEVEPAPEPEPRAAPAGASLVEELSRLESTIADLEAAVSESDTEFEPEEGHPFHAEGAEPLTDLPEAFEDSALHAAEAASAPEPPPEDADLRDAAWSEPHVGMDWAEATLNLARRPAARRLEVSEAEEALQAMAGPQSSYDALREELEAAEDFAGDYYDEAAEGGLGESVLDEAMLREMVAQMVREELRGSLGERITQNVRKLVRREIQRALMGQDYD